MSHLECWNCGADLADIPRPISRHANCPGCYEVLHCCRMCRWYAPGRPGDCDHDRADPPVEKENANFCDYFVPTNAYMKDEGERKAAARSRFADLFGEDSQEAQDDISDLDAGDDPELRSKLDDLFKD